VLPDVCQTDTDLARTAVLFSRIETRLVIDTRALVTLVGVRPNAEAIYGPKSRNDHLCEEKSVDVEKPESSWGTIGEQLLPN
jgi:hypothetical protein